MKNIPAILVSQDKKRKIAKDEVRKALKLLREHGSLAGISDRSMFEMATLAAFMEKELKREFRSEKQMAGSPTERTVSTNNGVSIRT